MNNVLCMFVMRSILWVLLLMFFFWFGIVVCRLCTLAFTVVLVAFSTIHFFFCSFVVVRPSVLSCILFYVSFIHVSRPETFIFCAHHLCIYSSSTLTLVNFHALLCAMSVLSKNHVFHFDIFWWWQLICGRVLCIYFIIVSR